MITHLIKARLLANAALNEYIGPEICASPTSNEWGALAEADIYCAYGEYDARAAVDEAQRHLVLHSADVDEVPKVYWDLLFPRPYWTDMVADAGSEWAGSVSGGCADPAGVGVQRGRGEPDECVGLMQLLPSTGKWLAQKHGMKHFNTKQLLDPSVNLELGTIELRQVLDRFGGQVEYALAAYNAGDSPVRQWLSTNDYKDVPESVESIP